MYIHYLNSLFKMVEEHHYYASIHNQHHNRNMATTFHQSFFLNRVFIFPGLNRTVHEIYTCKELLPIPCITTGAI